MTDPIDPQDLQATAAAQLSGATDVADIKDAATDADLDVAVSLPESADGTPQDVPPPNEAAPTLRRPSRRRFLKYMLAAAAVPTLGGAYRWRVEPTWVEYHDLPMAIAKLPASFQGLRLTHLTDLHVGDSVPLDYLRSVVARVNTDKPDVVVVTGDLITHAQNQWIEPAVDLLSELHAPTYVSFGNHDYGLYRKQGVPGRGSRWTADEIERQLTRRGMTVLRNRAVSVERPDGRLWIVGLDDFWGGYYRPQLAFADLPHGEPTIVLSHNPDTALNLDTYEPDWILCGHTHGGQVRLPFIGAPILRVAHREFDQGQFPLTNAQLYVSRGVGYLLRVRFMCRPEVPTFVLQTA